LLFGLLVNRTVNFQDQSLFDANKVYDKTFDRVLTPKFRPPMRRLRMRCQSAASAVVGS
jgi:hypothetical protein